MYVTDKSDSGRYYRAVYRVTGTSFDRSIVEHVADIVNGRAEWKRGPYAVTHRTTANLVEWKT